MPADAEDDSGRAVAGGRHESVKKLPFLPRTPKRPLGCQGESDSAHPRHRLPKRRDLGQATRFSPHRSSDIAPPQALRPFPGDIPCREKRQAPGGPAPIRSTVRCLGERSVAPSEPLAASSRHRHSALARGKADRCGFSETAPVRPSNGRRTTPERRDRILGCKATASPTQAEDGYRRGHVPSPRLPWHRRPDGDISNIEPA